MTTDAAARCLRYRRRILDISQQVSAAHISSAYSCVELVDCIYNELMQKGNGVKSPDTFIMSKGHGCLIQYVILEESGVLTRKDLDLYCKPGGRLGTHPDYGTPGIECSTGSLGHGLAMAVGIALAERHQRVKGLVYVVLSDGELQEGSTWEAILLASSFKLGNLVVVVDNNDYQALGKTSLTHPSFYPLGDKFTAFGWEALPCDGHDSEAIKHLIKSRTGTTPFVLCAATVKGKGVSYMENEPLWHYRSPNPAEYRQALEELR